MYRPPQTGNDADRNLAVIVRVVQQLGPALEQRNRARQNDIVAQLIALDAPMGGQWQALSNLVANNGEITLARKAMDLFVEASDHSPHSQYLKAALLEHSGLLGEAYELICTLPPGAPDPVSNAYSRGTAALFLGKSDDAREKLEYATRLEPRHGPAWLSLAMSTSLAREPDLAQRIFDAARNIEQAHPSHRAPYYYAKGKAHADLGDHAAAFAAFTEGASLMKALVPFDRNADMESARDSIRGFDSAGIAQTAAAQRERTARSIFVTGLPRSGTTLVQQILVSHSAVADGAEISRLPLLAAEIGGHSGTALHRHVQGHGVGGLARLWNHLIEERFPASGRVVDKSLNTKRFLGLAASILPEAPLIWVTRDPLDCAWSCFRTFFPTSMAFTYDLEDIAFVFRNERILLEQWQRILGERLLVVPYESLVEDQQTWIARILAHCGMDPEPQVFAPHQTRRTVTTASVMQVRRAINRDGMGSAEPYLPFLQPFLQAYRA